METVPGYRHSEKIIFGDMVVVPPDKAIAFSVNLKFVKTGVEFNTHCYLKVRFHVDGAVLVKKRFFICESRSCKKRPYAIYWQLRDCGFPERYRKELSLSLYEMYRCGEVREKEMLDKLDSLLLDLVPLDPPDSK